MTRLIASAILLLFAFQSLGQSRKFYYLCIGSGHYKQRASQFFDKDFTPLDELPAAVSSATVMQEVCEKYLHATGKTILSTEDNRIKKTQVFNAIAELDKQIQKDKAVNPCIIFYYCGHGVSENAAWSQIMVMGDFSVSGKRKLTLDENQREFVGNTLVLDEVIEKFEEKKYRYVVLLDCCRTDVSETDVFKMIYDMVSMKTDRATARSFASADSDEEDIDDIQEALKEYNQTMHDELKGWKKTNEYHQADAVVYSSPANKITLPVAAPNPQYLKLDRLATIKSSEIVEAQKVGPICRRTITAFDQFYKSTRPTLTVGEFVKKLVSPALDPGIIIPTTHSTDEDEATADHVVLIRK